MYSMVMLAAMTAAPETPDFFFKNKFGHGCHGSCYGCTGGCYGHGGGCYGSCYGGCRGSSCTGCYGGCHGYVTVQSGCCGGGCTGCIGSGCYGGYAFSGGHGSYVAPAQTTGSFYYDAPATTGAASDTIPESTSSLPASKGQLVVRVPADAKLYADGHVTAQTGTQRTFLTPDITPGKDFQYTLKIEVGGETKSRPVVVRAGHRTVVDFTTEVNDRVASTVSVNLPSKAKLFVDDQVTTAIGGRHTFRTPELVKGKPYTYQFRAEVEVDGRTDVRTKDVTFKAGEPVAVDFTETTATATQTALK